MAWWSPEVFSATRLCLLVSTTRRSSVCGTGSRQAWRWALRSPASTITWSTCWKKWRRTRKNAFLTPCKALRPFWNIFPGLFSTKSNESNQNWKLMTVGNAPGRARNRSFHCLLFLLFSKRGDFGVVALAASPAADDPLTTRNVRTASQVSFENDAFSACILVLSACVRFIRQCD